jgi:two-component system LytT family response regulator
MNLRVLIADDEPLARARIRRLLERDARVSIVDEARNGAEAVRLIERHRPDLVFLDVQMPKTDGFAVVEQVGADTMPPGLSSRLFAKGIVSTRPGGVRNDRVLARSP